MARRSRYTRVKPNAAEKTIRGQYPRVDVVQVSVFQISTNSISEWSGTACPAFRRRPRCLALASLSTLILMGWASPSAKKSEQLAYDGAGGKRLPIHARGRGGHLRRFLNDLRHFSPRVGRRRLEVRPPTNSQYPASGPYCGSGRASAADARAAWVQGESHSA